MDDIGLAAAFLGLGGVASAGAWGLMRDRRAILVGQAAQVACFGGHFALIGAYTGAAMCMLSLVQLTAAALPRGRGTAVAFWATAPAIAILATLTWHGPASAAAAVGLALGTLGRWQERAVPMRWFFLGSSMAWASHNVLVGSPFGMATDALALATNGWRLWRGMTDGRTTMRGWMRLRAQRQATLMGAMMERFRVPATARERHGRAFATAARRCLWCPNSRACGAWLERPDTTATMPFYCPNAPLFIELRAGLEPGASADGCGKTGAATR